MFLHYNNHYYEYDRHEKQRTENGAAALVQGVEADTASGGVETEKRRYCGGRAYVLHRTDKSTFICLPSTIIEEILMCTLWALKPDTFPYR